MGFSSLRRFDVQANYAFGLAILAVPPCAASIFLALRNFDAELGQIVYGGSGVFLPIFLGGIALSLGPAALACILGVLSAQQPRNDKSGRSWFGFFVGSSITTINIVLLLAFVMLRLKQFADSKQHRWPSSPHQSPPNRRVTRHMNRPRWLRRRSRRYRVSP